MSVTIVNTKPGISTAYHNLQALNAFLQKHRAAILATVGLISPADAAAVAAALDTIAAAADLFRKIWDAWQVALEAQ